MIVNMENNKAIKAKTAEEYFSLPKEEREVKGFYVRPFAMEVNFDECDLCSEWDSFYRRIKKEYPIQWFFREWLFSYSNPAYWFYQKIKKIILDMYYCIKNFIKPPHPRFIKVYPRGQFKDLTNVIDEACAAIIMDFYDEAVDSHIDWSYDANNDDVFFKWLKKSSEWLKNDLPRIEKEIDELLNNFNIKENRDKYNTLLEYMHNKQTQMFCEMIKYRNRFWT